MPNTAAQVIHIRLLQHISSNITRRVVVVSKEGTTMTQLALPTKQPRRQEGEVVVVRRAHREACPIPVLGGANKTVLRNVLCVSGGIPTSGLWKTAYCTEVFRRGILHQKIEIFPINCRT
jgi:hypothetical protein